MRRPHALSFSGSGHLLVYQLGAARVILSSKWGEKISLFAGSSGGAIAAAVCALLPRTKLVDFAESIACTGYSFNELQRALSGRGAFALSDADAIGASLYVAATHCRTGRGALFSHFRSAAELQRCLLASCAIPADFHPFDLRRSQPTYAESGGIIVDPACEVDGGQAVADDYAASAALPFSPHGEAYVDGGITVAAPRLADVCGAHTLTVSPVSGPQGLLCRPSVTAPAHHHLTPIDTSLRVPLCAPSLAGMRCFLSVDNARALRTTMGAGPRLLTKWYERGAEDAARFVGEFPVPPD